MKAGGLFVRSGWDVGLGMTARSRETRACHDRRCTFVAMACAAALWVSGPGTVHGQELDQNLWIPDGSVSAIACSEGKVYIGGQFTRVGPATGSFVRLDPVTGVVQQPTPKLAVPVSTRRTGTGDWRHARRAALIVPETADPMWTLRISVAPRS